MRFKGNKSQRKVRSDSRTISLYGDPIRGDGLDAGKWFKCWWCGFTCNKDRDALGDSQSRSGVVHEDYAQKPDYDSRDVTATQALMLSEPQIMIAETDSEGDPKKVKNAIWVSRKSSGCPLCHSLNWRGDYF